MNSEKLLLGACALLLATSPAISMQDAAPSQAPETPKLAMIKKLVGDWYAVGEDGRATEQLVSSMRISAGGNAVLETLFPGTANEMLTVYHQDGDDLVLTHYCVVGNQPHMKARSNGKPNQIEFLCQGGGNIRSPQDAHMHHATYEFVNEHRMRTKWEMHQGDQVIHTAAFDLIRKKA